MFIKTIKAPFFLLFLFFVTISCQAREADLAHFVIQRGLVLNDSVELIINATDQQNNLVTGNHLFLLNGEENSLYFKNGQSTLVIDESAPELILIKAVGEHSLTKLYHISHDQEQVFIKHIPLWLSIIPPLIAILLALIFKEVITSLFVGIWVGSFIACGLSFGSLFKSFLNVIDKYVVQSLSDSGHISIIVFSLLIGGMVAIITRNGGMQGIVNYLSKYARTARSSQFITWLLGVLIFFDDYANTLIVGNTMRPVTDKYKVSREKLAYIVDSTAAPIAAIAFITTWIGAELGYIGDAISQIGIDSSAYSMFLNSLQYAYYPIFTLAFMLLLIYFQKDFGSMYHAEVACKASGATQEEMKLDSSMKLDLKEGIIPKWYNAFIPVATLVIATIIGLFYSGYDPSIWADASLGITTKISSTIGNADSYAALLWSSLIGVALALVLTWSGRIMSIGESIETMINGFKVLLPAVLILVSAWSLAIVTEELHTSIFLTNALLGNVSPWLMPGLTFILAGIISFSTGSSWSTMAILYPIILPTTWAICGSSGLTPDASMPIMFNTVAVVLAGSVFGDHCPPISDTTILSSLASGCDHISHVKTQLPYAVTVGAVSVFTGGLLFYFGIPWWVNYIIGFVLLLAIVKTFGKKVTSVQELEGISDRKV